MLRAVHNIAHRWFLLGSHMPPNYPELYATFERGVEVAAASRDNFVGAKLKLYMADAVTLGTKTPTWTAAEVLELVK